MKLTKTLEKDYLKNGNDYLLDIQNLWIMIVKELTKEVWLV